MSLELANYGKKVDENFKTIDLYKKGTHDTAIDGERLENALRQFFPSSTGSKEVELRTYMEEYINYCNYSHSLQEELCKASSV